MIGLYPQTNPARQSTDLSGLWRFRFNPDDTGRDQRWQHGFSDDQPIAVPGSWNDQFAEARDTLAVGWYQTRFNQPFAPPGQRWFLRFNAVNYLTDVWLNGQHLGSHEGGHLPFVFEITALLHPEDNLLVVRVDGALAPDRVPPGNTSGMSMWTVASHPDTTFDFYPYCGIHRPVLLFSTPATAITDLTVVTDIDGADGIIHLSVEHTGDAEAVRVSLDGTAGAIVEEQAVTRAATQMVIKVANAAFWSPATPALYRLRAELLAAGKPVDVYTLKIGIRTIAVEDDQLLLNGAPIALRGFGRHEDFPVIGRGYFPAAAVKDFALMRWIGANSFRTSHYPYAEQVLQLADELGFLVIDELPTVGLFFDEDGLERRNALCHQYLDELITRDKNHPSVIMWSIANEPRSAWPRPAPDFWQDREQAMAPARSLPAARALFKAMANRARELDPTRLVTLVSDMGLAEDAFAFLDVAGLNRYRGWYSEPGQLDAGVALASRELDLLYEKFGKPVIMAEFGADAIAGQHALPPAMFSEEYQAEFITRYIRMMDEKPFVVGQHIWNMCDFKTPQTVLRPGAQNHKGVFTRDRQPKLAAHRLRQLWAIDADSP